MSSPKPAMLCPRLIFAELADLRQPYRITPYTGGSMSLEGEFLREFAAELDRDPNGTRLTAQLQIEVTFEKRDGMWVVAQQDLPIPPHTSAALARLYPVYVV